MHQLNWLRIHINRSFQIPRATVSDFLRRACGQICLCRPLQHVIQNLQGIVGRTRVFASIKKLPWAHACFPDIGPRFPALKFSNRSSVYPSKKRSSTCIPPACVSRSTNCIDSALRIAWIHKGDYMFGRTMKLIVFCLLLLTAPIMIASESREQKLYGRWVVNETRESGELIAKDTYSFGDGRPDVLIYHTCYIKTEIIQLV